MIAEIIPLPVDIAAIRSFVETTVLAREPVWQTQHFGGWSITSSNGDYRDGWHQGHRNYAEGDGEDARLKAQAQGQRPLGAFRVPTELCQGPMADFIQTLEQNGLHPRRARLICLKPGGESAWHRDGSDEQYAVRLHLPIITNVGCFFEARENGHEESEHLKADGTVYLLKVNRIHRVINRGSETRIHLVVNVFDTKSLSRHHQFNKSVDFLDVTTTR